MHSLIPLHGFALVTFLAWAALVQSKAALWEHYGGSYKARFSYLADAPIAVGRLELGDLDTMHARARYMAKIRASDTYSWRMGLAWERYALGLPPRAFIPNTLDSVALALGNTWNVSQNWTLQFEAEPGIYSDFEDINLDDFNAPLTARAIYAAGPNLDWVFAIVGNFRGEFPVVGGVGVRWRFADRWQLNLVLPEPRVEYIVSPQLSLFAGGEFNGGTFRVARDFGSRAGRPELNDEDLSYRDARVGGGLLYNLAQGITVQLEGGWMIDRRFKFEDRDLQINGEGAPYVTVGLTGSY